MDLNMYLQKLELSKFMLILERFKVEAHSMRISILELKINFENNAFIFLSKVKF